MASPSYITCSVLSRIYDFSEKLQFLQLRANLDMNKEFHKLAF